MVDLKSYIREIPDFPSAGILFRDVTPLLRAPEAFTETVDRFAGYCEGLGVDAVAGIEARGFLFAAPLALRTNMPLIPLRKKGKLPYSTHSVAYALEYGADALEVHTDAVADGQRVLIVDDLLATGGTLEAAANLVQRSGGEVAGLAVVVELTELGGRQRVVNHDLLSLVSY